MSVSNNSLNTRDIFNLYDVNGTGKLSIDAAKLALNSVNNIILNQSQLDELLSSFSDILYTDFESLIKTAQDISYTKNDIHTAFLQLEKFSTKDDQEDMKLLEFKNLLKQYGEQLDDQTIEDFFQYYQQDTINGNEFEALLS